MSRNGSAHRAEEAPTLRTECVNCGQSTPTERGHADRLETDIRLHNWGLVGYQVDLKTVFPTCSDCYDAGWRPPGFVWMN